MVFPPPNSPITSPLPHEPKSVLSLCPSHYNTKRHLKNIIILTMLTETRSLLAEIECLLLMTVCQRQPIRQLNT